MNHDSSNRNRIAEYLDKFDKSKVLKQLIKADSPVIFDVGANVGETLNEFKSWWPSAKIHCFEPQKECFEALEVIVRKFPDDIKVNLCAVGNESVSNATFYTHDINNEISGFNKINLESLDSIYLNKVIGGKPEALSEYKEILNHKRHVDVIRLDNYMSSQGIDNVNLIKIDTQGFEPEVLEGLGERLCDVDIILTELMFFDYYERRLSFSDIEKFLIPAGFELYDISHVSKNPMNGRTDWADIIYVNNRLKIK